MKDNTESELAKKRELRERYLSKYKESKQRKREHREREWIE